MSTRAFRFKVLAILSAMALSCTGEQVVAPPDPPDPTPELPTAASPVLAFAVQPTDVVAGEALASIQVELRDSVGSVMQGAQTEVTVALADNPSGATLAGPVTIDAINGLATFSDLVMETADEGYTLSATADGYTSATSRPFEVARAALSQVVFLSQPPDTVQGTEEFTVRVALQDAFGNAALNVSDSLILDIAPPPVPDTTVASLAGVTAGITTAGEQSFTVSIDQPGRPYQLVARAPELDLVGTSAPTRVTVTLTSITVGGRSTCGVTTLGRIYCWGGNAGGQLGDGTRDQRLTPVLVSTDATFTTVSAGHGHTCGLTTLAQPYCWGTNFSGQIGDGLTALVHTTPVPTKGGHRFESLHGGFVHTCGRDKTGALFCWGGNNFGQLGVPGVGHSIPTEVASPLGFVSFDTGHDHTCSTTTDGRSYCWGHNGKGQLGDGTVTDRDTPTAIRNNIGFERLYPGNLSTCGLTSTLQAYCWGRNNDGELGDSSIVSSTDPVAVVGDLLFDSLSVQDRYACGLAGGNAYCWGANDFGNLGIGRDGNQVPNVTFPTPVSGGHTFVSLSAGGGHACGLTKNGQVYCWGHNDEGQLGTGQQRDSSLPVPVVQ